MTASVASDTAAWASSTARWGMSWVVLSVGGYFLLPLPPRPAPAGCRAEPQPLRPADRRAAGLAPCWPGGDGLMAVGAAIHKYGAWQDLRDVSSRLLSLGCR